jgi:hypothetical protein
MAAAIQELPRDLRRALEDALTRALGEAIALAPFAAPKGVADETLKLVATGDGGKRRGVVLCAPASAPGLIARACARGREARDALGPELGAVVVLAYAEGESEGRSWAFFPPARPLGDRVLDRLERRWLAGALIAWLRAVTAHTAAPTGEATRARTDAALSHAESEAALPAHVREAARVARARLAAGAWAPRHVFMHGDLWSGNLLGAPGAAPFSRRFVLIDWDTSRVAGYPFFDLVRAARSFALTRGRLARELAHHAALLGFSHDDARAGLVAALGHIGSVRESFPLERYAEMCADTLATFDAAR